VKFDGAGPERWAMRWRREHRAATNLAAQVRRQRRLLRRLQAAASHLAVDVYGSSVPAVICVVFPDCSKALSVARCESGFSVTARNGQYFGVFQMGSRGACTVRRVEHGSAVGSGQGCVRVLAGGWLGTVAVRVTALIAVLFALTVIVVIRQSRR
jgi:hypothetical protein